jgi:hypothetical protein
MNARFWAGIHLACILINDAFEKGRSSVYSINDPSEGSGPTARRGRTPTGRTTCPFGKRAWVAKANTGRTVVGGGKADGTPIAIPVSQSAWNGFGDGAGPSLR